jgi:hypothetical protein
MVVTPAPREEAVAVDLIEEPRPERMTGRWR